MELTPAQLAVLRVLSLCGEGMTIPQARARCGMEDGVFALQVRALEENGLVACLAEKIKITEAGQLELYIYNTQ